VYTHMCTSCEEGHTHVSVLHMCPSYLLRRAHTHTHMSLLLAKRGTHMCPFYWLRGTHTCVPLNTKDTHMCPYYLLRRTHTCVPLNKKDTCVMPFRNLQANLTIELLGSGPIIVAAQLSLHDAPIFRLLLKIAVF